MWITQVMRIRHFPYYMYVTMASSCQLHIDILKNYMNHKQQIWKWNVWSMYQLIICYLCNRPRSGDGARRKGFPDLRGPISSLPELMAICDSKFEVLAAMLGEEMNRTDLDQVTYMIGQFGEKFVWKQLDLSQSNTCWDTVYREIFAPVLFFCPIRSLTWGRI